MAVEASASAARFPLALCLVGIVVFLLGPADFPVACAESLRSAAKAAASVTPHILSCLIASLRP